MISTIRIVEISNSAVKSYFALVETYTEQATSYYLNLRLSIYLTSCDVTMYYNHWLLSVQRERFTVCRCVKSRQPLGALCLGAVMKLFVHGGSQELPMLTLYVPRNFVGHFEWRQMISNGHAPQPRTRRIWNMCNVVVNTEPAGGLAPSDARPSAGTILTNVRSHIYTAPALPMTTSEGLLFTMLYMASNLIVINPHGKPIWREYMTLLPYEWHAGESTRGW